ncbi:MAG: YihY family inner membrane protein [Campylobacter sp.]|nr:YihY family inner membrane protein [Campylobacter sp.]
MQAYTKLKKLINSLYDKEILHYASSLSFHTILSIVPILLISFSVFTRLPVFDEYYHKIKNFVFENLLPTNQEILSQYVDMFLQNSGNLGIFGIVAVIITSVMFFNDYEYSISQISGATIKSFWQNFSKYWTLVTIGPIGIAASFYLSSVMQNIINQTYFGGFINLLALLPYIIIWAIFALAYQISLSSKICVKSILFGSFIASFAWNLSKFAFIKYAIYNKTYLSIYGSFSILLFFFLWIYIAWIIFLMGVKICLLFEDKKRIKSHNSDNIA